MLTLSFSVACPSNTKVNNKYMTDTNTPPQQDDNAPVQTQAPEVMPEAPTVASLAPEENTAKPVETPAKRSAWQVLKYPVLLIVLIGGFLGAKVLYRTYSDNAQSVPQSALAQSQIVVADSLELQTRLRSEGLDDQQMVTAMRELIYMMNDMGILVLPRDGVVGGVPGWAEVPHIAGATLLKASKIRAQYKHDGKPIPVGMAMLKLAEQQ